MGLLCGKICYNFQLDLDQVYSLALASEHPGQTKSTVSNIIQYMACGILQRTQTGKVGFISLHVTPLQQGSLLIYRYWRETAF